MRSGVTLWASLKAQRPTLRHPAVDLEDASLLTFWVRTRSFDLVACGLIGIGAGFVWELLLLLVLVLVSVLEAFRRHIVTGHTEKTLPPTRLFNPSNSDSFRSRSFLRRELASHFRTAQNQAVETLRGFCWHRIRNV
ncbi:hypothetical protein D9758_018580 [Tetrapyrgos nigripes]|uniref:Uncharacterized protein n=1 Tax=Tetrapyrgos nigripes TaxID=182062 RepID=A0A8H5F8Z2_9AGAR|nr:hypothetical protein D9758_018580 [Tetrapyrgos nigripes]